MAKRFIDTGLFRKPFMRSLEAPYKALWIYLLCECDHAGVWCVELDVAEMRMGMKLDPAKALEKMQGAVVEIDGGAKWFLPDFIEFQYGTLNPSNRVHESVIAILEKNSIDLNDMLKNKPLTSPLNGAKDKDKDITTKKKDAKVEVELIWPRWAGDQTKSCWNTFKEYRKASHKFTYRTLASEQAAITLLSKMYTTGEKCFDGLQECMAKGWKFPPDPNDRMVNGKGTNGSANGKTYDGWTVERIEAWMNDYKANNGGSYPNSGTANVPKAYKLWKEWI